MPDLWRGAGRPAPFRARVLPADDPEEPGVAGLLPELAADEFWEAVFQLLYTQHGGSGLGLTLAEVMELEMSRIQWLLERLGEQRRKEAREIEQAARRGRRR